MATTDFPAEISSLRSTYSSITEVVDIDALSAEVAQLNEQAAAPDLCRICRAAPHGKRLHQVIA